MCIRDRPTRSKITNGVPAISKKTTELKKSEIGLKASSILWSNPFSWALVVKEFKNIINDKRYLFMVSYLMQDNMRKKKIYEN